MAREPAFALLQTWAWGELKRQAGWRVYRIAAERRGQLVAGVQLLIKPLPLGLAALAYVPRGPLGAWLDDELLAPLLAELHRVARQQRAICLRIEPPLLEHTAGERRLRQLGFRPCDQTNQPRTSLLLDLRPGLDALLAGMHQKTRYNLRYAARRGVEVRVGGADDLPLFYRLMQLTGRRGGFSSRGLAYYRGEWQHFAPDHLRLLIASFQGRPLAANVSARCGAHAAYLHGASSGEHANLQPNALLMWEAISWAADQGCESFDLWGIPDEVGAEAQAPERPPADRTDGLWGVYRFKRGFGGRVVRYLGAFDYVYTPALYALVTNRLVSGAALERAAVWLDTRR